MSRCGRGGRGLSLVIKLNVVSGSKGCPTFSKLLSSARLRKEKGGKKEPGGESDEKMKTETEHPK